MSREKRQKLSGAVMADEFGHRLQLSRIFEPLIVDIVRMIEHQVQQVRLKRPERGVSVSVIR